MHSLVFDTSAILNFGQRDKLEGLLVKLSGIYRLVTTPEVVNELTDPKHKKYNETLLKSHFVQQKAESASFDVITMASLTTTLGSGEVSVIVLAQEIKATAVLDDSAARASAGNLGLTFTGTLGLMHEGMQKGWLTDDECMEKVRLLHTNKFRIPKPPDNATFAEYFQNL